MAETIDSDATEPRSLTTADLRGGTVGTSPGETGHLIAPLFVGYARVSTTQQLVHRQLDALREAGCTRIFVDRGVTGSSMDRPELQAALAWMRPGDVLTIVGLDRLGRSVRGVLELVDELEERSVGLRDDDCGIWEERRAGER